MKIMIDGNPVDMPRDFSVSIDELSPIFNDDGSQTVPATVPYTPGNVKAFGFPHRLDWLPEGELKRAVVADGAFIRSGSVNLTEAGTEAGYSFNIGFDNSEAYAAWRNRKLRELSGLPEIAGFGLNAMKAIYAGQDDHTPWLAVFPVAVGRGKKETDANYTWEMLNVPRSDGSFMQPKKVKRFIGGEVKEVNVPDNYGLSPFLKVWKLLELVFADLRLKVTANPFLTGDLQDLVVLNNCADTMCVTPLRIADILPDCTVMELLDSLWARFGLVYDIDFDSRRVRMALLRDILRQEAAGSLDDSLRSAPVVTYDNPKYIRLNARTTLEEAEPAETRWEDFIKNVVSDAIRTGSSPELWKYRDPDWEDYLPDDAPGPGSTVLGRQYMTALFYWLDGYNTTIQAKSSPFFSWDPQPEGCEEYALESVDECVPVGRVSQFTAGSDWNFTGYCPLYLTGSIHRHSYIAGDEEREESTPLAFMFAYTSGQKTVGRFWPETESGKGIVLDDGRKPETSLLWQFKGGLYDRFWRDYDRILREGSRSVDLTARVNKIRLRSLDKLALYRLQGIPCLIDTLSYSLPSPADMEVEMTVRPAWRRFPGREDGIDLWDLSDRAVQ